MLPLLTCITGGCAALTTPSSACSLRPIDFGSESMREWHCNETKCRPQLRFQMHSAGPHQKTRELMAPCKARWQHVSRRAVAVSCPSYSSDVALTSGNASAMAASIAAVLASLESGKEGDTLERSQEPSAMCLRTNNMACNAAAGVQNTLFRKSFEKSRRRRRVSNRSTTCL